MTGYLRRRRSTGDPEQGAINEGAEREIGQIKGNYLPRWKRAAEIRRLLNCSYAEAFPLI